MKNATTQIAAAEPVVIADECGDTLWDEVLQQEVKACEAKSDSANVGLLLRNLSSGADADNNKK